MSVLRMMKGILILFLGIGLCLTVHYAAYAQTDSASPVSFSIEADMLPYISGGHYLSGVLGIDHFNLRWITTKTTVPDFVTPEGFKNWDLDVNAVIIDYFPNENREGLWLGGGIEHWDSHIRSKNSGDSGTFSQKILTFGTGYLYPLSDHWYINPWAALHYNLSDKNAEIGSSNFKIPDIMYEASIKLGYRF
ncbi:MAG TPA: hypothetical protein DDW50_08725 [Firmicutes bacterium]|jgi:hypothetical protein|nr:hypothetical protein [Bacillota bacterium]